MIDFKAIKKPSLTVSDESTPSEQKGGLLLTRSANQCLEDARRQPIPKMLFSEFWHEGELCILFADTNLGKSILAVQIADAVSKGHAVKDFKLGASRQKVLYFDFELSIKQFEKRYSTEYRDHYCFDENLLRTELNIDFTEYTDFEAELKMAIVSAINIHDARILIIDNLTYLKTQSTEAGKEALLLMKMLKELKHTYNLSLLVLAHTPKRDGSKFITINDLAGSKQLANFADSVFSIGKSFQDKNLRYLKQIKARATEIFYDTDNVMVVAISKPDNFLGFQFLGYAEEAEHLRLPKEGEADELKKAILSMKQSSPSLSYAQIATRLNTYPMKVKRVLDKAERDQNDLS